ncbi:Pre-mRNA-processing factor 40 -like protein A [Capsicum baccatum]|uniref:Pre-mRNA-processing factor 40-like protein A n=1 Tax=Capsicum baccatum TaxID=33114 RepID=A0A2G2V4A8_CAPBA|nr:Pre-mRNA-processing factor 40 -like protein A [Capsicum baccatum]
MVWNTHHDQGHGLGCDKLGIKARFMVPGYYYNKVTRTSKWRMPDEVKGIFETNTTQDAVVYGDGFSLENKENVKKDVAITKIGGAAPSVEKTVELGPLVYEIKAEAKSAFKTLLESTNIRSDYTWDQAMRPVINDRRYGALKSLCERKQAFNEALVHLIPIYYDGIVLSSLCGKGKNNFTDLSKPHGHSKKVYPKKSGRVSSRDLSVPVLIRTIRRLTKEKVQMASKVSSMLRNQVVERVSAKEHITGRARYTNMKI